jgi:hypothetical protein
MTDGSRAKNGRATPISTYLQAIVFTSKIAKVFGILISECLNSHGPASQTEGPIQMGVMSKISRQEIGITFWSTGVPKTALLRTLRASAAGYLEH